MREVRSVSKGIVSLGAWSLTKLLVSSVVLPIYSRTLGVEGYGQYAYYIAMIVFTSHLCNWGMMPAATKFIAERPTDLVWRYHVARLTGGVNLLAALSVSSVVGVLVWKAAGADRSAAVLSGVLVGVMLGDQAYFFARGIFHGLRREELVSVPGTIGLVIAGAFGVVCAMLGMGVVGPFLGQLLAYLLVIAVLSKPLCQVVFSGGAEAGSSNVPVAQVLRFGVSSMCFTWLGMTLYSLDMILVRQLAGDREAGLYAAAVQWSQFVWFIPIAVEGVMLQSTARWWAEGKTNEMARMTGALLRYVVVACSFLLIFVGVFAEDIISIYFGRDFAEAATALRWLAPGVLVFCIARVVLPVIQSRGHLRPVIAVMTAAMLCDVGLNWLLVPRFGAIGAAQATTMVFCGVTAAYLRILVAAGVRVLDRFPVVALTVLCAASALVMAGVRSLVPSTVGAMIIGGCLGTLCYWIGVFRCRFIRIGEVRWLVHTLPGPIRAVGIRLMRYIQPGLLWLKPRTIGGDL